MKSKGNEIVGYFQERGAKVKGSAFFYDAEKVTYKQAKSGMQPISLDGLASLDRQPAEGLLVLEISVDGVDCILSYEAAWNK